MDAITSPSPAADAAPADTEASLRASVESAPNHFRPLLELARHLSDARKFDESVEYALQAVALDPESFEATLVLGSALKELKRYEQARQHLARALALNPTHVVALFNLAFTLRELGLEDEAEGLYKRIIEIAPQHVGPYVNLGSIYEGRGDHARGYENHVKAVQCNPDEPQARHNLSMSRLRMGEFEAGWADFEYRRKVPGKGSFTGNMTCPEWQGEPLEGRKILITSEQGAGDAIQFIRYARLLKERGAARVDALVSTALVDVMGHVDGIDHAYVTCDAKDYDYWALMMSLPYRCGTTMASIPAKPYITPDPVKAETWRTRLTGIAQGRLRVGLVWAGNPLHARDNYRSITLRELEPVLAAPNIAWFALQKGAAAQAQLAQLGGNSYVCCLSDYLANFADTAAVIANLDLVIAVDTSVAHLAGALGKQVWVLLAYNSDWRWLIEREDSPWYPTASLFRQTRLGQWSDVVDRLGHALDAWQVATGMQE
ncbi:tetratricopeptide repeat protein [Uliginosibacterium sp. sgz301328]|uniref:tetratricopeptide repeat protein n=1 Tax=Uliginosibacterium sp. sgz301328 TaxID=3243764 RepID=UPI00359D4FBC